MLVDLLARGAARQAWLVRYARWATSHATWWSRWHFHVGLASAFVLLVLFVDR